MGFLDSIKSMFGGSDEPEAPKSERKPEPAPERTPEPSMSSKADIMMLEFLKRQGLVPNVDEEGGYIYFKYQMLDFAYRSSGSDQNFISVMLPWIFEYEEEQRGVVLEAINKMNLLLKTAKFFTIDGDVYITAEGVLDTTPNLDSFVPRMIDLLLAAREEFYKELKS